MATRFGNSLKPRRDIYTVAIEIAAFDHDIAEVHADAQHDVAILRLITIGSGHTLLEIDGALYGVDGAGELDQHAVAGSLEDAALMFADQRVEHILASRLKRGQRGGL